MAFTTLNGFDVELASSKVLYEGFTQAIQHIEDRGCTSEYLPEAEVRSVHSIDLARLLPRIPGFRVLGSSLNGGYGNTQNQTLAIPTSQTATFTIPVDMFFDRSTSEYQSQIWANKLNLRNYIQGSIIDQAADTVNMITHAKQWEAFFTDSFSEEATTEEIATSISAFTDFEDASEAYITMNSLLDDGVLELGAKAVPPEHRQAFISTAFKSALKLQYKTNASEASNLILASGYINPYTKQPDARVDMKSGYCGIYDGVFMYQFNSYMRKLTYLCLNLTSAAQALLDNVHAYVVYGKGTVRGIAGPRIYVNPHPTEGGSVIFAPQMKVGVKVLSGKSIKMCVKGGFTAANLATIQAGMSFGAPTDAQVVAMFGTGIFNDNTTV